MKDFGEYVLPAIVVVAGCVWFIFNQFFDTKTRIAQYSSSPEVTATLNRHADTNEQLLNTLKSIESRLDAIEHTLNEVG